MPTAIWFSDNEAPVPYGKLVYTFDFGGNPAGVELIIENIVLKILLRVRTAKHHYPENTELVSRHLTHYSGRVWPAS